MSRTSHASALAFAVMVLGTAIESPAATNSFYDFENFEGNAIDRSVWSVTGDGIGVSGGAVTIARNDPVDSMTSVERFEGQFIITFTMSLQDIVWNDTFHGISLFDPLGQGISFGFSKYMQFYSAEHVQLTPSMSQSSFFYTCNALNCAPAFALGTPYTFLLTGTWLPGYGAFADLSVNRVPLFHREILPRGPFLVTLPGYYNDGDGAAGALDATMSRLDHITVLVMPAPEPATYLLFATGLVVVGWRGCRAATSNGNRAGHRSG